MMSKKKGKKITREESVQIWNTFFSYAYSAAAEFKGVSTDWNPTARGGGKLDKIDACKLRLLTFLILAIETRNVHLILDRVDNNITSEQASSLTYLNLKAQWSLLPLIYNRAEKSKEINFKEYPHEIVTELKNIRDKLFHADLNSILNYIRSKSEKDLIKYVVEFWDAMEYMNALVGRRENKNNKPDPEILALVDGLRK